MLITKSINKGLLSSARRSARSGLGQLRSVSFLSLEDDLDSWPRARKNTILNVCSEGMILLYMPNYDKLYLAVVKFDSIIYMILIFLYELYTFHLLLSLSLRR